MKHAAATALAALLVACNPPLLELQTGTVEPLRKAFLLTPLSCNKQPALAFVIRTERSEPRVCLQQTRWSLVESLQLDVVRYGTILELLMDNAPVGRELEYPRDQLLHPQVTVMNIRGTITHVLKGSAPLGHVDFPAITGDLWTKWFRVGRRRHRSGWPEPIGKHPRSGLVFLPTDSIVDGIFVGCVEGHVVWTADHRGYLHDVRLITQHLREAPPGALSRKPASSAMVRELAAEGGMMMGYFLAEHCNWRVALALLQTPSALVLPSKFQTGLFEGLWRMRALMQTKRYPAEGWKDVDDVVVKRHLVRWAAGANRKFPTDQPFASNLVEPSCRRYLLRPPASLRLMKSYVP